MSSPPVKYVRYFDFTTYASLNPEKPLPGGSVDVEFNRIKSTTDQTIDRLALIQRDDGGLRDGMVTTSALADGSVTTPKLADYAVTAVKIAPNCITDAQIAIGSIGGVSLQANCINSSKIVDGSIATVDLADQSVTTPKLGLASVGYPQLQPAAVNSIILAPNAAGTVHIIDLAVTTPKLADGAVTSAKIAPGTVIPGGIPPGYITNAMMGPLSVGTSNLIDGSVTNAKLAANAVGSGQIVDGSIDPVDLSPATYAIMTAAGTPRGAWLTSTNYNTKDAVTQGSGVFVCITAHLSGVFATDLAAGKWYQTGQIFDQMLNKASNVVFNSVGISRVPEAWIGYKVLAMGGGGTIAADVGGAIFTASNIFYDGANWRYINTGAGGGLNGSGGGNYTWYGAPVGAAGAVATITEHMRLDGVGNLGVGRVPEAWDAGNRAFVLGNAGSLNASVGAGTASLSMTVNTFYDGTNHKYLTVNACSLFNITNGAHLWYSAPSGPIGANVSYIEKMRLDVSGNLGLGRAPEPWVARAAFCIGAAGALSSDRVSPGLEMTTNSYWNGGGHVAITTGPSSLFGLGGGLFRFYNTSTVSAGGAINYVERLTMDLAGNLGFGGAPLTGWAAQYKSIQIGAAWFYGDGTRDVGMVSNAFFNGSTWVYGSNAPASILIGGGNGFSFYTAPSGAGNSICNFNLRMSVENNGTVSINDVNLPNYGACMFKVRSGASGNAMEVKTYNAGTACIAYDTSQPGTYYGYFGFNAAAIGSITANGTGTGVLYNVTSDYRLKNITGDFTQSGAIIDALQPKFGTWKKDGSRFVGLVAHDVQGVVPAAVCGDKDAVDDDGEPIYQQLAYSSPELITCMIAELKSIRARLDAIQGIEKWN